MKSIALTLGIFTLMISCGSPADRVEVEDMENACDCTRGFMILAEDALETVGNNTTDDLRNDRALVDKLQAKIDKIEQLEHKCHRKLKISIEEMEACDSEVKEMIRKFEERF